ncbi:hypothetical protein [Prosthecobacter sp.]|jgi:hypothetical protein|uniref:hypothetical protein n=1 Tax=Prosthecobacter sp. TaxID=1965333 RepID=UPI0037CB68D4
MKHTLTLLTALLLAVPAAQAASSLYASSQSPAAFDLRLIEAGAVPQSRAGLSEFASLSFPTLEPRVPKKVAGIIWLHWAKELWEAIGLSHVHPRSPE